MYRHFCCGWSFMSEKKDATCPFCKKRVKQTKKGQEVIYDRNEHGRR